MDTKIILSNGEMVNVPDGADPDAFRRYAEARLNPAKKSKSRTSHRKSSRRSFYASTVPFALSSAERQTQRIARATTELVERVNSAEDDIPFDGRPIPYVDDDNISPAALGLEIGF